MRVFIRTVVPLNLALLFGYTPGVIAQIDPIVLRDDATQAGGRLRSERGRRAVASVLRIGNYSATVAPIFVVGEVRLIRGTDTTFIGWDHPLAGKPWRTGDRPGVPLQQLEFPERNRLHTLHFARRRCVEILPRHLVPVSEDAARRFGADEGGSHGGAAVPDTLVFRLELLDHASGVVLRTLHQAIILSSATWNDFSINLPAAALDVRTHERPGFPLRADSGFNARRPPRPLAYRSRLRFRRTPGITQRALFLRQIFLHTARRGVNSRNTAV